MIALGHLRAVTMLLGQLEGRLKKFANSLEAPYRRMIILAAASPSNRR
jgi:hypothetical protein